jgi:hypothetical protein
MRVLASGITITAITLLSIANAQAQESIFTAEAQHQRERAVDYFARQKTEKTKERTRESGVEQIHSARAKDAGAIEKAREAYVVYRNSLPVVDEERQEAILEKVKEEQEKRHDVFRKQYAGFQQRLENVRTQTGLSEKIEYDLYPPTTKLKSGAKSEVKPGEVPSEQ